MQAMHRNANEIRITKEFVDCWSARYDEAYLHSKDHRDEQRLKAWLAEQRGPRFLDGRRFLGVALWKSRRPRRRYKRNSSAFVRKVTELAFQVSDDRLRMHTLMALDGVRVPVASAVLHFAFPDRYPILDVRVLRTLTRAGLWPPDEAGTFTPARWLEFTQSMRGLARRLRVDMRHLDKALWAFDKFGPKPEEG